NAEQNTSANAEQSTTHNGWAIGQNGSAPAATIVRQVNSESEQIQSDASHNEKRKEDSVETGKVNSAEAAPLASLRRVADDGRFLALLERKLTSGLNPDITTRRRVEAIMDRFHGSEHGSPEVAMFHQAERILVKIE